jgi:FkbM family methyltransferase
LNPIKRLVFDTFHMLGYDLKRIPPGSSSAMELSGLSFENFLSTYLAGRNLKDFFFVQIGAFDGKTNDHVYGLVKHWGLKGLIVEPQPIPFATLRENYGECPQLIFENVAIGSQNGEQPFYRVRHDLEFLQYVNQAASFNHGHTERLLRQHITREATPEVRAQFKHLGITYQGAIESVPVSTRTLPSLLTAHGITRYDLLQIDTEGFDFEVLKMAEVDRFAPSLVNYEHEHLTSSDRDASWHYLRNFGYQLFTHKGDTTALHESVWKQ